MKHLVCLLLFCALHIPTFAQDAEKKFGVKAVFSDCEEKPSRKAGIKSLKLEGDTLVLDCFFYANCIARFSAEARLYQDTLQIQNHITPADTLPSGGFIVEVADCNCFFCAKYFIFPYEGKLPEVILLNRQTFEENQKSHEYFEEDVILDDGSTLENILNKEGK